MGRAGAVSSAAFTGWAPAEVAAAAHRRGDPVSAARRAALADVAALLSSGLDGTTLVLPVARQWSVAFAQSCSASDRPGSGRARSVAQCRSDRQPECQNHRERRASEIGRAHERSEEHTSELQSLMRTSYAVFCLKKKKKH